MFTWIICRIPSRHTTSFWSPDVETTSCVFWDSWYMARFFNSEYPCWRIALSLKKRKTVLTLEYSYRWLLNNCASDCWTIVPDTFEQPVQVTVEQSCQRLLNSHTSSNYWKSCNWHNHASDCCTIVSAIFEEPCQ